MRYCVPLMTLALTACSGEADPMTVCTALERAGVAQDCRRAEPAGIGAAASGRAIFKLADNSGNGGQVLTFGDATTYERAVGAFELAAPLAGPHRYASPQRRVLVQLNRAATAEVGAAAATVVAGL